MAETVLIDVVDRVATITLNRPEKRNALSVEALGALHDRVAEADERDDVDVLVLTGADPAFCAGLDLGELASDGGALGHGRAGTSARGIPLGLTQKPVIGAVNGVAITGGLELALACDFLVASERARFADTHARIGIQPWWGLTVLLPQAIGLRRAREMSATGNFVDAVTALEWGLVNHVVAHEELAAYARGLAADIVSNDQQALRTIFTTYAHASRSALAEAWRIESETAAKWQGRGIDPEEVARRRGSIIERGRRQL